MEELAREFYGEIRRFAKNSDRWLSHVVPNVNLELATKVVDATRATRPGLRNLRFVGIIWHPDSTGGHLHIYHICNYQQSHCRCKAIQIIRAVFQENQTRGGRGGPNRFKQRGGRQRIIYCAGVTEKTIFNWLQYYLSPPREILYLEVFSLSPGESLHRLKDLQGLESTQSGEGPDERMEVGGLSLQEHCDESNESSTGKQDVRSSQGTQEMSTGGSGTIPGGRERVPGKVIQRAKEHLWLTAKIKYFLPVPLSAACDLDEWIADPQLCVFDKSDPDYKRAYMHVQRELSSYTYDQLLQLQTTCKPVYYARHPGHYLDVDSSIAFIDKLLRWQTTSEEDLVNWLSIVHSVMERELPKCNSVYITSPPNSGKTWFVDMLTAFYINVGQVNNFNRNTAFPLNDCVNRRVLVWNEPNVEPSAFETIKMLLGGDPCPANVKYQSGHIITKTPVIITSNSRILDSTDPVWSSRCKFWNWRPAPFLKNIDGYPHPMAWPGILNKYNILD